MFAELITCAPLVSSPHWPAAPVAECIAARLIQVQDGAYLSSARSTSCFDSIARPISQRMNLNGGTNGGGLRASDKQASISS